MTTPTPEQYSVAASAIKADIDPEIPGIIKMHVSQDKLDAFYTKLAKSSLDAAFALQKDGQ